MTETSQDADAVTRRHQQEHAERFRANAAALPEALAVALGRLEEFVARFVHFESEAQRTAVVLWIAETYVADSFGVAPYLHIKSPEKQSGKTLLLEVIELTAKAALLTSNISVSALFRLVDAKHPTLLIDEVDAVFPSRRGGGDSRGEELRALINSGYRRGVKTYRVGGKRFDKIEGFDSFGPKALAGIGELPDTIADRAIPIRLQRKPRSVTVSRWRRDHRKPEAAEIRDSLGSALAELHSPQISGEWPQLPDQLSDRGQDLWEPLLAVADYAGHGWASRGRAAAIRLHTGTDQADETQGVRLLGDIRTVWTDRGDKIFTRDLLAGLIGLEEAPWGDLYGKPITARFLAKKLRPYGPRSRKVNIGGDTLQGWRRADFEDTWDRYLANIPHSFDVLSGTSGTIQAGQGKTQDFYPELSADAPSSSSSDRPPSLNSSTSSG